MREKLWRGIAQVQAVWAGYSRAWRLAILMIAAGSLGILTVVALWGSRITYATLFANLSAGDAGLIVEQLNGARVPYLLEDGGTRILVPAGQVHELRIRLATAGLPQGGGIGFELFDRSSFGVSDFVQKLNYQRALQGELGRSIAQLREVQHARVHIVLPQASVFRAAEKPATASVVLGLKPGARLTPEQVRGIIHLVSGSVEGLEADRVAVIDTAGRLLSQRAERGTGDGLLEQQMAVETALQRRVQTMLEEVLGPGKASVRVAVQLDLSRGERTEERLDPTPVVRSESRTTESSRGNAQRAGGVPGTGSNMPGGASGMVGPITTSESVKEQEAVQYEVGRVLERRTLVGGEIRRLSVAVLIDPPYRVSRDRAGAEQRTPVPRERAELEMLRNMVMRAVGYNASRGDEVDVAELAFDTSAVERERELAEQVEQRAFWWSVAKPAGLGAVLVVLLLLAIRPLKAFLRRPSAPGVRLDLREPPLSESAVAAHLEAKETAALAPSQLLRVRERERLQERIATLASTKPEQTAQLIRRWMLAKQG
jgi:flagellar M-ring protein FliF